jgi:ribonuclease HI
MMGFAAVLLRDGEILVEAAESGKKKGTNNTSEMLAVLLALVTAQEHIQPDELVTIVSDSNLAIGLLARSHKSTLPHLIRLRYQIRQAEKVLGVAVAYEKGDTKDELFQLVDALAKEAVPPTPDEAALTTLLGELEAKDAVPPGYKEKETDEKSIN